MAFKLRRPYQITIWSWNYENKYGYESIQITRVTRILNRFLRNRFEEKIELFLEQSGVPQK